MLEIGGVHPITAVLGNQPSILPDFENTSLSVRDDVLGDENAADRSSVRLREIAVKCMAEAIAQSRIAIADSTQTRRDGREFEYKTGDLVDFHRKPEGIHAKYRPGWIGPAVICDLSSLPERIIGVKWNGKPILTSVQTTRPHIAYPVFMMYRALGEHDHAIVFRGAAKASNAKVTTYSWYLDSEAGWTLTQFAINHRRVYQACLQLAVSDIRLTGCIGARVGTHVAMLPPFASTDFSTIVYWNAHEAKVADVDPRKPVNLHTLFDKEWTDNLWVLYWQ